jgi:hypothetical protein
VEFLPQAPVPHNLSRNFSHPSNVSAESSFKKQSSFVLLPVTQLPETSPPEKQNEDLNILPVAHQPLVVSHYQRPKINSFNFYSAPVTISYCPFAVLFSQTHVLTPAIIFI